MSLAIIVLTAPFLGAVHGQGVRRRRRRRATASSLPVERLVYRLLRVDPKREQRWTAVRHLAAGVQRRSASSCSTACCGCRSYLPVNPNGSPAIDPALAFNTAVSFVTNTNWQNYGGEIDHRPPHPDGRPGRAELRVRRRRHGRRRRPHPGPGPAGLVDHRQLLGRPHPHPHPDPAAAGVRLRGRARQPGRDPEPARGYDDASPTLEGDRAGRSPAGRWPARMAIKQLGTNGGGFFNANSIHPFENPNGITNFLADLRAAASSRSPSRSPSAAWSATSAAGPRGVRRHARPLAGCCGRRHPSPRPAATPTSPPSAPTRRVTAAQPGGNMEGKDVRFGSGACGLFAASTTGTSTGAVNCQHDSMTPIGGGDPDAAT